MTGEEKHISCSQGNNYIFRIWVYILPYVSSLHCQFFLWDGTTSEKNMLSSHSG